MFVYGVILGHLIQCGWDGVEVASHLPRRKVFSCDNLTLFDGVDS